MCLPVEPFKVEKEWEFNGLKCAVVLAREHGHRCGYVRLPPGHFWHGCDYDEIDVDVHGGLTFAKLEPCSHEDGIGWWVGFDCAHAGDHAYDPYGSMARYNHPGEHYWTHSEVVAETERLASQLGVKHVQR